MTPLAQIILDDQARLVRERQFKPAKYNGHFSRLVDGHCFETTAIMPFALGEVGAEIVAHIQIGEGDELCFLPAPVTWIEWQTEPSLRMGTLLSEHENTAFGILVVQFRKREQPKLIGSFVLPLKGHERLGRPWAELANGIPDTLTVADVANIAMWHYALLSLINSPRGIGRRSHAPHIGLERRLGRSMKMVGRFPLHAWTEIVLEAPTLPNGEGGSEETHLTWRQPLHFVRKYHKKSLGIDVPSHWRGNPALGIKRSRYKVVPPTGRAQ